ncbi:MAG: S46 family peptidase [Bacteroidia bacterium]|nr:S46 family peptidase [Bacteroidia bacterium]
MNRFFLMIVLYVSAGVLQAHPDEGMWIPILLEKYNYEDMKKKGFKLTPEDIYSINKACMKDAVVIFGRGCTGEIVSGHGLILTNHHCGYPQIQNHSSLEHDYLTDGFWAMTKKDEIANPGLSVQILERMEDVTQKVLDGVTGEETRQVTIKVNIEKIAKEAVAGTHFNVVIRPFYNGNEYYLFIYEEFKDVRLVGAPPSGIGKFGGDTDNWMWPRHTGDFSLFRIYANKNNDPAEYSPDNVPYKPKKFFPISLKGVKKGDFTMVFGFPGRTTEYLSSSAVEMISQVEDPNIVNILRNILDIMGADMETSGKIRIQYSSKYAGVANYWKKLWGESKGLRKINAVKKKKMLEEKFQNWANSNDELKKKYGNILSEMEKNYKEITPYKLAVDYISEAFFGIDLMDLLRELDVLTLDTKKEEAEIPGTITNLKAYSKKFFKDYNLPTDKKIFITMVKMYSENVDIKFIPGIYDFIDKKFKGNISEYADFVYSKSMLADETKLNEFLDSYKLSRLKKFMKDPAYKFYISFMDVLSKVQGESGIYTYKLDLLNRAYMTGLREMQKDKIFYPDANFTFRIAYGQVSDYEPMDGVYYNFYTTLDGIMQKDDSTIYDYNVPKKLKELYKKKDYGRYGENGVMKVAFTTSNHTTGGNSGSPVLNGNGELIGINFDRNWEGTMSDIMYDPSQCRNISLDIRYALFIIEKFAGAKHLIDEMKIVE